MYFLSHDEPVLRPVPIGLERVYRVIACRIRPHRLNIAQSYKAPVLDFHLRQVFAALTYRLPQLIRLICVACVDVDVSSTKQTIMFGSFPEDITDPIAL